MKFRKKPIEIDAKPWFNDGDHEKVFNFSEYEEGVKINQTCEHCNSLLIEHGKIKTLEGDHIVCPGDYIICGIKGEYYPCKPDIFHASYDIVDAIILTPTNLKTLTKHSKKSATTEDCNATNE